jgi:hypothetical protein
MTDTSLILIGCGWLLVWGVLFAVCYWKGEISFDTTSMRLVLAMVAWIGIAPILFGMAAQAQALVAVIDLVVCIGLGVAVWLAKD